MHRCDPLIKFLIISQKTKYPEQTVGALHSRKLMSKMNTETQGIPSSIIRPIVALNLHNLEIARPICIIYLKAYGDK